MTVNDVSIAADEEGDLETELTDGSNHPVHGFVVFSGIAGVGMSSGTCQY